MNLHEQKKKCIFVRIGKIEKEIIGFKKNKMNVHCNNLKEDTIKQPMKKIETITTI